MNVTFFFFFLYINLYINNTVTLFVQLPDVEGRAGMAAIVDTEGRLDLEKLSEGIHKDLPPYARPVFIRVIHSLPITSKF